MFYSTAQKKPSVSEAIVDDNHQFSNPTRLIKTVSDMKIWEYSEAYFEYSGFILAINEAIKGKSNKQGSKVISEPIQKTMNMLDILDKMIDEVPPIQQPQRFGNQAFRTWYQRLQDSALGLIQNILPENLYRAVPEIMVYLVEGFGNSTRIDYGTGHELSFIMFMCCLFKIGFFHDEDRAPTGCKIFPRYLEIVRKLQKVYRMEPAGSHGVWSLDDYQFVPFIWGSSQLTDHPIIEPNSFLKQEVLNEYSEDYMFLSCIQYINEVKTGPFAEHSNQLWSISGVLSWSKVNGGLIKMYKVEVLGKFPVVQHILFGSLFTLNPAPPSSTVSKVRMRPVLPPGPLFKVTSSQAGGEQSGSLLERLSNTEITTTKSFKKPEVGMSLHKTNSAASTDKTKSEPESSITETGQSKDSKSNKTEDTSQINQLSKGSKEINEK